MSTVVYIGLDVHKEKIQVCSFIPGYGLEGDRVLGNIELGGDYDSLLKNLIKIKGNISGMSDDEIKIVCGYEAGCLGYSLERSLQLRGIECHIMAPSTMSKEPGQKVKTDRRDALMIAKCLAYGTYKSVFMLDAEDESVRDYLRMRDDLKDFLKKTKQHIMAMLLRLGIRCDEKISKTPWTQKYLQWLRKVDMGSELNRETMNEYLRELDRFTQRLESFDQRIHELCQLPRYKEYVKKLICFAGIKEHTALSLLSEIGDFTRFKSPRLLASYLGLTPGEHSSGSKVCRTAITKSGNSHLRRLLTESAQGIMRSSCAGKSKALRLRQQGAPAEVIEFADKCTERLQKKSQRMGRSKSTTGFRKPHNVIVTAIARELACFVCAMMNGLYEGSGVQANA